jgi:hypothetical protein
VGNANYHIYIAKNEISCLHFANTWLVRVGDCFLPELKQHGYEGEFWQKPPSAAQVHLLSMAQFPSVLTLVLLEMV